MAPDNGAAAAAAARCAAPQAAGRRKRVKMRAEFPVIGAETETKQKIKAQDERVRPYECFR